MIQLCTLAAREEHWERYKVRIKWQSQTISPINISAPVLVDVIFLKKLTSDMAAQLWLLPFLSKRRFQFYAVMLIKSIKAASSSTHTAYKKIKEHLVTPKAKLRNSFFQKENNYYMSYKKIKKLQKIYE